MSLSKKIPARTVTLEVLECSLNFATMTPRFRQIRSKSKNAMTVCFWCKHEFADGEMLALAITAKGNKALCQSCGEKAGGK
jgi:hypothetical protein